MKNNLYKSLDVWQRKGLDCAVRFRCFEIVGENKFCVQSVDYFNLPITDEKLKQMDKQFLELIIEVPPEERSEVYPTLKEAISRYEEDF